MVIVRLSLLRLLIKNLETLNCYGKNRSPWLSCNVREINSITIKPRLSGLRSNRASALSETTDLSEHCALIEVYALII